MLLKLTGLGNRYPDVPALELCFAEGQSLLEPIQCTELNISEAFGFPVKLVLDNADTGDFAAGEKALDVALGDFEREITKVCSIRWSGWQG